MGSATRDITDGTFADEVENYKGHVLVDFWAPWCGPCRMMAPALDEVAVEYQAKMKVAKLDIQDNEEAANKFSIRSIPCLILFKDGKEAARQVGRLEKAQLKKWIDSALV